MDSSTGKLLNDFTGHVNEAYRCRACFGHAEASVICGDENGQVWAWDLLDVCPLRSFYNFIVSQNSQRQKSYSQIRLLRLMKNLLHGLNIIRLMRARWSLPVPTGRRRYGGTQIRKIRILFSKIGRVFMATENLTILKDFGMIYNFCKVYGHSYRLFWFTASEIWTM